MHCCRYSLSLFLRRNSNFCLLDFLHFSLSLSLFLSLTLSPSLSVPFAHPPSHTHLSFIILLHALLWLRSTLSSTPPPPSLHLHLFTHTTLLYLSLSFFSLTISHLSSKQLNIWAVRTLFAGSKKTQKQKRVLPVQWLEGSDDWPTEFNKLLIVEKSENDILPIRHTDSHRMPLYSYLPLTELVSPRFTIFTSPRLTIGKTIRHTDSHQMPTYDRIGKSPLLCFATCGWPR